jgi:hypothetical protein
MPVNSSGGMARAWQRSACRSCTSWRCWSDFVAETERSRRGGEVEVEVALSGAGSATGAYAGVGVARRWPLERQGRDVITQAPRAIDTLNHARRERSNVELVDFHGQG